MSIPLDLDCGVTTWAPMLLYAKREKDPRVRAVVVDSVYDYPKQMVKIGVEKTGVGGFPLMVRSAETGFEWLNYGYKNDPPLSAKLKALNGVPVLFIAAADDQELASITRDMFLKASEPREQQIIAHGNFVNLPDDEKRTYENRVVTFFLTRCPPASSRERGSRQAGQDGHTLVFLFNLINEPAARSWFRRAVCARECEFFMSLPAAIELDENISFLWLRWIPLLHFMVEIKVQTEQLTATHVCGVDLIQGDLFCDDFTRKSLAGRIQRHEMRAQTIEAGN